MGKIKAEIERISKEDISIKNKVEDMIWYIGYISRYSCRNKEIGIEEFWNWLKNINVKDEHFIDEL